MKSVSPNARARLHLSVGILISLFLFVTGILLCAACYSIYTAAEEKMFTYARIGAAFSRIALPFFLTVGVSVLGTALAAVLPHEAKKKGAPRSPGLLCRMFARRVSLAALDEAQRAALLAERKHRHLLNMVQLVLCLLSFGLPLIYLLQGSTFPAVNKDTWGSEILHGLLFYLLCLLPLLIYTVVKTVLADRSHTREVALLREALKQGGGEAGIAQLEAAYTRRQAYLLLSVRLLCLCGGAALVLGGVLNGGMQDVYNNAITICKACIGIG